MCNSKTNRSPDPKVLQQREHSWQGEEQETVESCLPGTLAAEIHYGQHCNKCRSFFASGGQVSGNGRTVHLGWVLQARCWGNAVKHGWSEHGIHLSKFCGSPTLVIRGDLSVSLYFLMLFIPEIIMLDLAVFFQLLRGFSSTGLNLYICKRCVRIYISRYTLAIGLSKGYCVCNSW